MASRALIVAMVAAGLLIVSVGVDLAFNSTVEVRAGVTGQPLQLVGQGSFEDPYSRPAVATQTFRANASDTITIEVALLNAYPWSVSRSFTITRDGCYDGALVLGTVRVQAPASGKGAASEAISVETLLRESSTMFPKPAEGASAGDQPVYLQICRGERYAATATFNIEEVSR